MKLFPINEEEYIVDESIEQFIKRLSIVTDRLVWQPFFEHFLNRHLFSILNG
jgi:hypothetical protein